jgi:hypothetical protein
MVGELIRLGKDHFPERIEDIEQLFNRRNSLRKTPLMLASERGDAEAAEVVREVLKSFPEIQIDEAMLAQAIEGNQEDMLSAFVDLRPDSVSVPLLKHVVTSGNQKLLDVLLERGNNHLFYNHELLHGAIKSGQEKVIKALLGACPDLVLELDAQQKPVLSYIGEIKNECLRDEIRNDLVKHIIRQAVLEPESHTFTETHSERVATASNRAPTQQTVPEKIRKLLAAPEG